MAGSLTIVGLGPGRPEHATLEAADVLRQAAANPEARVYAFSNVEALARAVAPGLAVQTLDGLLRAPPDAPQQLYHNLVARLMTEAFRDGHHVFYAVAGNALVINDLVLLLRRTCRTYGKPVRLVHGLSFLDVVLDRVFWRADPGLQLLSAWAVARGDQVLTPATPSLIYELGERSGQPDAPGPDGPAAEANAMLEALAARLLALFPADHPLALLYSPGSPDFQSLSRSLTLGELAHQPLPALCNLWVPALGGPAMERELA
jgi:tetrapyrrole methylase family protein / MazG family protein